MNRYPIKIELLSETIWGNGESKNGVVNTDILIDKEGFPYLMGKTFKGYLKKACIDILEPFYGKNEIINEIFGIAHKFREETGEEEDKDKKKALSKTIRFTNFYLDDSIKAVFYKNSKRDPDSMVLEALTDIRFSINIEKEKLRAVRVLKKGLIFRGYIETMDKLEGERLEFIERAVKALKHMGINKSRGKGLVKVELGELEKDIESSIHNKETDNKKFDYILYELDLKEPVKIGSSQSQYDYEETKTYISGATIRGAIINKYLKNFDEDSNFNELLKKVCFYDSYPIFMDGKEKRYSFPTPSIFRISKDTDKDNVQIYRRENYSTVFEKQKFESADENKREERRVIKLKKGDFSYYEGNTLYQFNVEKDYKFHHTQEKPKENIFRYEAIAKGQKFYGVIDVSKVQESVKTTICKIIEEKPTLYLGGARTAGYGKTVVSDIVKIKDFEELTTKLRYLKTTNKTPLDIYFLSDAVLRGSNHEIRSSFDGEYIKEKLGIDNNNVKMDINPVIVTGFNAKYKSTLPPVYGVEKGSVIRYETCVELDNNTLNAFMKIQHGDRKQDGLGRVIINPEFLQAENIEKKSQPSNEYKVELDKKATETQDIVKTINKCRNDIIVNNAIKNYTVENLSSNGQVIKEGMKDLTISKINNLIQCIDKCLLEENPYEEFKKEINKLTSLTRNLERNKANDNILKLRITRNYTIENLAFLEKSQIQNYILKEVLKGEEAKVSYEIVLIRLIRSILYFSLKDNKKGWEK